MAVDRNNRFRGSLNALFCRLLGSTETGTVVCGKEWTRRTATAIMRSPNIPHIIFVLARQDLGFLCLCGCTVLLELRGEDRPKRGCA